jgi:preprotein translocase subunit YajC
MLAIVAVFYFVLIRPQQKRAREHREMLDNLKKGDTVVTTGGLIGKISGMNDSVVTLEVAEKIRLRVVRAHVASKQAGESTPPGSN